MELTDQEQFRRDAMNKLRELNIDPYPSEEFEVDLRSNQLKEDFEALEAIGKSFTMAGRLMSRRIMGKASFAVIQDSEGKQQLYFNRDEICPGEDKTLYNTVFKKLTDIGDIIGVTGTLFTTQTGEKTLLVKSFKFLSKSLRPLPVVKEVDGKIFDAFTDPEQRYRMRYLDLIVNPDKAEIFRKRSKLISSMRNFLTERDFLEVETPILQPIYGGAAARPFTTHHNTLDTKLYLRIANELYLKRLIVGGFEAVFEFAKDFRNEGMSRFHNPEFTMLELYVAYKDYNWMMKTTEELLERVAVDIHGTPEVQVGDNKINFKAPYKRMSMYESILEYTDVDVSEMDEKAMRAAAQDLKVPLDETMGRAKIIDEIFGECVEPHLIQPTFITNYPVEMSPLAKSHRSEEGLVERFELICNSKEILNAFSELNDPIEQRRRFEEQIELGKRGDEDAMMLDEDFLKALEFGMPPTAGIGIGIDRLAMIMTNSSSIQEVLFFPQMRPEGS